MRPMHRRWAVVQRWVIGCSLTVGLALCLVLAAWVALLNTPTAQSVLGPLAGDVMAVCALTSTTPPLRVGVSWDACPLICSSLVVDPAQWRQTCLFLPWPFGLMRGSLTP